MCSESVSLPCLNCTSGLTEGHAACRDHLCIATAVYGVQVLLQAFLCSVPRVWLVYRLYFTARPMEDGLAEAIDEGKIGPRDDPKTRGKILADEYGWDKDLAKKIWCATRALLELQHLQHT